MTSDKTPPGDIMRSMIMGDASIYVGNGIGLTRPWANPAVTATENEHCECVCV